MTEIARLHGTACLSPTDDVTAGEFGTWTVTYTAGALGVDENAAIKLIWRFASDWGKPQLTNPAAPNYTTVSSSADVRIEAQYQPKGYVRPWGRCLHVDIRDGSLAPGDTLTITIGDTSAGSPGSQAQTFLQRDFRFMVLVDAHGTWQYVELPDELSLGIVPSPAERLVVVAPTDARVNEPFRVTVKAEDRWGNPATGFSGEIDLDTPAGALSVSLAEGIGESAVSIADPVCHRLTASFDGLESGIGNPIIAADGPPALVRYWGDLHGQSAPTIGTGTIEGYFRFAHGYGVLDFTSHQGNDFQITREQWDETQRCVAEMGEDGRFIPFLGYEWSGNPGVGGDHNVIFREPAGEQIHRSSHMQVADTSDADTDRSPIEALFGELRDREAFTIAHVGGRPAELGRFDDAVEPLVEIHSAWGTFEWMLTDALAHGRKVGVVANSDDHSGRPGANRPGNGHFGTQGGLTCVLAPGLTRAAVWDALRSRRCYGTSGPRIAVDATVAGSVIGGEVTTHEPPSIRCAVHGTAPVERIDVLRGAEVVHSCAPELPEPSGNRVRIAWRGARVKGRGRETHWDGSAQLQANRIVSVAPYAFDSPAEGITGHDETHVAWVSKTCGDADGVILTLADGLSGSVTFQTGVTAFALPLTVLRDGPFVAHAGGLDQQATVEVLPDAPGPMEMSLAWTDLDAPRGEHAYWLRITQEDGHQAWTSPVFVTIAG